MKFVQLTGRSFIGEEHVYDALGRVTNFFKWISVSSFFYVTKFLHSSYTFRKGDFPFVDNFFRRIRG